MDILNTAKDVFDLEIKALEIVKNNLGDEFEKMVTEIVQCNGKVVITGIGKSGHIGKKMAATFASLGTPAFFLHPAEAQHGDLGMISSEDIVLAISYSGESEEVIKLIPNIKKIGAKLLSISSNLNSTLAQNSNIAKIFPKIDEADPLGLAPTSSTTSTLVYGDALAVVISQLYGFTQNDFGLFHPAGTLGKKVLLTVSDLMFTDENIPIVEINSSITNAIVEISKKGLGIIAVEEDNCLVGVITDGDLRRALEKEIPIYDLGVKEIMSNNPKYTFSNELAINTLIKFSDLNITAMPVVNDSHQVIGMIRFQDIINVGIVL